MDWIESPIVRAVWDRLAPASELVQLGAISLLVVLGIAAVAVVVPPIWRVVRIVITLVHELGHAIIGVLFGRKFTGFVVRGDMSGHAVTTGPSRGVGRVVSTWAGYPAPAVVGAALVLLGGNGWAAPAISAALVILVVSLIRVRSLLTALVMVVVIGAIAALWWWRDDALQAQVLTGLGVVLVVGAWRHLGAVWASGGSASDPAVLARLTGVPVFVWNGSFALVCLAASGIIVAELWPMLGSLVPVVGN